MRFVIGEFTGTYIMMTLGIGNNVLINYLLKKHHKNKWIGGLCWGISWGISIYIASLISEYLWHTADFSPLVSFAQVADHQITWAIMITEAIVQIIASWYACKTVHFLWAKRLRNIPLDLGVFATVPHQRNRKHDIIWELIGTAMIIFNFQLLNTIHWSWYFKVGWSSLLMLLIITFIAPITGAALNPTRDLVPRHFYTKEKHNHQAGKWHYAIVPLLGPILGCVVALIIDKVFSL